MDPRRARDALPRAAALGRAPRVLGLGAAAVSALLAGGCGGGARQDAAEPKGSFPMKVVRASFPSHQSIARQTKLELQVRNTGSRTVPTVAVTIDSFEYTSHYPELADDKRPIWAIEQGPGTIAKPPVETEEVSLSAGAETAYVNTWAMGSLAPGQTRDFTWRAVPVKSGSYTVRYTVAAGLSGKARAVTDARASGESSPVQGQFAVDIAPTPKLTHVNPSTGRVEVGQIPSSP
jgi:hypothetical protein